MWLLSWSTSQQQPGSSAGPQIPFSPWVSSFSIGRLTPFRCGPFYGWHLYLGASPYPKWVRPTSVYPPEVTVVIGAVQVILKPKKGHCRQSQVHETIYSSGPPDGGAPCTGPAFDSPVYVVPRAEPGTEQARGKSVWKARVGGTSSRTSLLRPPAHPLPTLPGWPWVFIRAALPGPARPCQALPEPVQAHLGSLPPAFQMPAPQIKKKREHVASRK